MMLQFSLVSQSVGLFNPEPGEVHLKTTLSNAFSQTREEEVMILNPLEVHVCQKCIIFQVSFWLCMTYSMEKKMSKLFFNNSLN